MTLGRLSAIALLGAMLVLPGAVASAPQGPRTVLPGYWEYRLKVIGITADTDYWCVRPDQVDKFFNGPCNRHHTCTYNIREVGGGKARFVGYWQNKEGKRANVEAVGEYSDRSFILRVMPTRGTNGVPIRGLSLDARWLGETCKPGAKTPR